MSRVFIEENCDDPNNPKKALIKKMKEREKKKEEKWEKKNIENNNSKGAHSNNLHSNNQLGEEHNENEFIRVRRKSNNSENPNIDNTPKLNNQVLTNIINKKNDSELFKSVDNIKLERAKRKADVKEKRYSSYFSNNSMNKFENSLTWKLSDSSHPSLKEVF
jgi:hypothetical protein